ncbi:hypothetical protein D3C85_1293940 [compost metagenome]
MAIVGLAIKGNARRQKIFGLDCLDVVVLGGDLTGQQVELVEGALDFTHGSWLRVWHRSSGFVRDP